MQMGIGTDSHDIMAVILDAANERKGAFVAFGKHLLKLSSFAASTEEQRAFHYTLATLQAFISLVGTYLRRSSGLITTLKNLTTFLYVDR
jgi:hypothetical protein